MLERLAEVLSDLGCKGGWNGECEIAAINLSGKALAIPSVVAALAVILFLFFLYSSARLFWCSFRFRLRFGRLIRFLDKERAGNAQIDRAALNRVGEVLGKDKLCKHGWRDFTETLVVDSSGSQDERIYNTRQSEELFPDDEIVAESMHPTFFRAVPGILTSLGLLGTFLAILLGLSAIHVPDHQAPTTAKEQSSAQAPNVPEQGEGAPARAASTGPAEPSVVPTASIEGIGPFVNALSGKFFSSVLALAFAILFTLMETRSLRIANQTYRRFCQAFDGVFPRRTTEELLTMMVADIRQQRAAFEHFNTDLSARFRDGVSEGLGPTLERISDGLRALVADRDSNIEALMEKLTGEFRTAMSQSAGVEFGQIASAMERASELIGRANQQQEETRESFARLIVSLEESRSKQEQVSTRQAETINSVLQQMVDSVGRASNASRSALDGTIQELVERTRRESAEATQALQDAMRSSGEQMAQQITALLERVGGVAGQMENAGVQGSRELADSIQRVSSSLEASAAAVARQMQDAATGLVSRTSEQQEDTRKSFAQLIASLEESRSRQEQLSNRQAETMNALLQQMVDSVGQASTASRGALDETIQDLGERTRRESAEATRVLQEAMRLYGEQMAQQTTSLVERVERGAGQMESAGVQGSRELADSIQRVSASLEASAGAVARQMQEAVTEVVSRTRDWSDRVARELGTLLSEHRSSIGAVSEVRDALEGTIKLWRQGTEDMRNVLAPLRDSVGHLQTASGSFRDAVVGVEKVQNRSTQILDEARSEFERIESMGGVNRDLLREHQRVFGEVQVGLAGILSTIAEQLQELQSVSARGLNSQLSDFDRLLATATRKLGAAIDELSGVLEDATDRFRPE